MNNLYGYNFANLPQMDLPKVKGIESVRMFPTQPNSKTAVFDEDEDVFYVIITDSGNYKTIRRFRYVEEPLDISFESKYVTKEEFNSLKEMINNVQYSIQKLNDKNWNGTNKSGKQHSNGNRENDANGVNV